MSILAEYMLELSTVDGTSSYHSDRADDTNTGVNAGINNTNSGIDPTNEIIYDEDGVSFGADISVSSYADVLEGMIVGILQAPAGNVMVDESEESSFGDQTIVSSVGTEKLSIENYKYQNYGRNNSEFAPRRLVQLSRSCPLSISTSSSAADLEVDEQCRRIAASDPELMPSLSFQSLSLLGSSFSLTPMSLDLQRSDSSSTGSITEEQLRQIGNGTGALNPMAIRLPPTLLAALNLPRQFTHSTLENKDHWYSDFNEEDWDAFRRRAIMVLRSLRSATPDGATRLQQLPPMPPQEFEGAIDEQGELDPCTLLSKSFICPLCQNAIVGALTMDCGCGTNVCLACWEYRSATEQSENSAFDLASGLGYTIIPSDKSDGAKLDARNECPCCSQAVRSPLGCNALDVAILQVVQQLSGRDCAFQRSYYRRLRQWRDEVGRRQVEFAPHNDDRSHDDHIVAQLILEEENFWQQRNKTRSIPTSASFPGALAFVAALVASIGIKILTQNRS